MSLADVRAGLASRFETITGLRFKPTFPQRIDPPGGFIGSMIRDPGQTFEGSSTTTWEVFVCLGQVELARNLEVLDDYADATGPSSIEAALTADPDLAGGAYSCALTDVRSPVTVEIAGVPHLGAQFTVEVFH